MLKSIANDLSGAADVCRVVRQLGECYAVDFLVPGETILFSFQSAKEEFTFTNQALIKAAGESATTTRRTVERFLFKHDVITGVEFETAGNVDRDCEIKFHIGGTHMSIDIAKAEVADARDYYKVLELLSRAQKSNERSWEFATLALKHSGEALYLTEQSGQTLVRQSDETVAWLEAFYKRTHPESYRDVIEAALRDIRTIGKAL